MTSSVFFYCLQGVDIGIMENGKAVTGVFFGSKAPADIARFSGSHGAVKFSETATPLIKKTAAQIEEYLAGKRKQFTIPIAMYGTEFQMAVWQALQTIPFGETRSYKEIAIMIGKPKAVRAVGMANNRNPVSIIVPCHRVIGHDGKLVGYGGGLSLKQHLLELEHSIALKSQKN